MRSASQDAPYVLSTHLNPVSLVSYRNMFPSNLVEASFQQVSSPGPSACSQDGAQLHTGLPLCPPTAWTGALPLPLHPPTCTQGGHPKAGGCWGWGTGSQGPPCLPSASEAPLWKQHTSLPSDSTPVQQLFNPWGGVAAGWAAAGRERDTRKGCLREGRVVKGTDGVARCGGGTGKTSKLMTLGKHG